LILIDIVTYGDNAGNTVEENSSVFTLIRMRWLPPAQGNVDSKTLLKQNHPDLNWGYRLTQVVLYNGHKTEEVVVVDIAR